MNSSAGSECWSCASIKGVRRISPGDPVYEGEYWVVEHAYPCALKGWLVIVLKRHAEALHELTPEEFVEFGAIQARACSLLHEQLACEKEYVMCVAEAEHFTHIHYHVVPKPVDLPDTLKGSKIYAMLKIPVDQAIPPGEVQAFCDLLRSQWGVKP